MSRAAFAVSDASAPVGCWAAVTTQGPIETSPRSRIDVHGHALAEPEHLVRRPERVQPVRFGGSDVPPELREAYDAIRIAIKARSSSSERMTSLNSMRVFQGT